MSAPHQALGLFIVAGAAVGGGMFALPFVSAGMWMPYTAIALLAVWWLSYRSAVLVLATGLHFPVGASFPTYVSSTLGRAWSAATDLSICALLYTLLYAYFSGFGSVLTQAFALQAQDSLPWLNAGLGIAVAVMVWLGAGAVGRLCGVLLTGMAMTFIAAVSGLLEHLQPTNWLAAEPGYAVFALAALPAYLTSFGFSPVIPSLITLYGHNERALTRSVLWGSAIALAVYLVWCAVVFGNLQRGNFAGELSGSIGALVQALSEGGSLGRWLNLFSFCAVASSFLAVGISLADFLADRFAWRSSNALRLRAVLLTFVPPGILSTLFPQGFVAAISLAGLIVVFGYFLVPALMHKHRTGRADADVWLVAAGGVFVALCHVLAMAGMLPVF